MKKIVSVFVLATTFFISTQSGAASWILYDDFNSGVLDVNKWEVQGLTSNGPLEGEIAVVNNKLRITHYPPAIGADASGQIIGLLMKQYRASISGVRADVKVHSCDGEQQARVQTVVGYTEQPQPDQYNLMVAQSSIRPDQNTIAGLSFIDTWARNGAYIDFVSDVFWGGFYGIDQIADKTKRISVRVNKENMRSMYWYVAGEGQSVKHLPDPVTSVVPFKLRRHVISTRRRDNDGMSSQNCIVDYDNVMVFR